MYLSTDINLSYYTTPEGKFDLPRYKADRTSIIAGECWRVLYEILPADKQDNIMYGSNAGYPAHLSGDTGKQNVIALRELLRNVYHTYAEKIRTAGSREEVDAIIAGIVFPDEKYILKNLIQQ